MHGGTEVNGAVHDSVRPVVVTPVAARFVGALSTPLHWSVDETDEDERDEGAMDDDDGTNEDEVTGAVDEVVATDDDLLEGATELDGAIELDGATDDGVDDEPVPPLRLP